MPIVILVAVVILVVIIIALRNSPSPEQNIGKSNLRLGLWCLVGGLAATVGIVMIGLSAFAPFGWISGFDPPGWLRIITAWLFTIGVIASPILGTLSLKQNSARRLGIIGLVLVILSVGVFFVIMYWVNINRPMLL